MSKYEVYPDQDDSEFPDDEFTDPRISLALDDDCERGGSRKPGILLDNMISCNCDIHSTSCWGFCFIRTYYAAGSDARIASALSKLAHIARLDVTSNRECYDYLRRPNSKYSQWDTLWGKETIVKVMDRYHDTLLQDQERLDGASVETTIQFHNDWAAPIGELPDFFGGPRSTQFILLDEETLQNIEATPVAEDMDVAGWVAWHDKVWGPWLLDKKKSGRLWVRMVDVDAEVVFRVWIWGLVDFFIQSASVKTMEKIPLVDVGDDEKYFKNY